MKQKPDISISDNEIHDGITYDDIIFDDLFLMKFVHYKTMQLEVNIILANYSSFD